MRCSICGKNASAGWQSDTYKHEFACMSCDEAIRILWDTLCAERVMAKLIELDMSTVVSVLLANKSGHDELIHAMRSDTLPVEDVLLSTGPSVSATISATDFQLLPSLIPSGSAFLGRVVGHVVAALGAMQEKQSRPH